MYHGESYKGLTRGASLLSFLTAISRIFGLLRESVMAYLFGAGFAVDAFIVAFRLPNLLRRLFAEGALSISFTPIFAKYLKREGTESTRELADSAFTALSGLLLIVTVLGMILAPFIIYIIAPGFEKDPERFSLAVNLTRIMFPFIFFIGILALSAAILNTHNHFLTPALAPILLNIIIIACAFIFYSAFRQPIYSMATGVIIGGILQVLLQLPVLKRYGYTLRIKRGQLHRGVDEARHLFLPATFGAAVYQVNLVVTQIIASFLSEGSIAFLWYAGRFFELPLGVFAIAIATVALPKLSLLSADENMNEWKSLVSYSMAFTLFITIPSMFGLLVLAGPVIKLFFEGGRFTASDSLNTANALYYYALGLWAVGTSRVLVQAFYSLKDTRTPVKIAVITFTVNICLSLILMEPMKHSGLALATTLSSILNFTLLVILLRRKVGRLGLTGVLSSVLKTVLASGAMAVMLLRLNQFLLPGVHTRPGLAGAITLLVLVGIIIFLLVSYMVKNRELMSMREVFR